MNLQKLQWVVVDALEDVKAQDIRVFDTTGVTSLFDRVVVASGTSNRQTRALADRVREKVKEAGGDVLSVEGGETGEWVLVDLADIVVHVMQPAIRQYYNLEEIWGGKPVRVDTAAPAAGRARKAAADAAEDGGRDEAARPAPRRRASVKKADMTVEPSDTAAESSSVGDDAPRKPATRRTASKKAADATPAAKPATRKPAAKRPARVAVDAAASDTGQAARKASAPRKVAVAGAPAAERPAARKPAAVKPASKKPAVDKSAAKKPAAKRPAAKTAAGAAKAEADGAVAPRARGRRAAS